MNRLLRFGNRLSRRNGILRKVARVVELVKLGDIYVGDNTIIGANAVVTCDIPDNSIAVGIPVRVKKINSGELK